MTDWATYPLQVMARDHVLNDEEIRLMCAEIARLREELAAARAMSEWQPIETAPKDGSKVDVFDGYRRLPDCWWQGSAGWIFDGHPLWDGGDAEPTHWMPIPPKPEVT